MRVKWLEIEAGSTIPYEEHDNLIHEHLEVFTPNLRDPDAKWIFPGVHKYPFSYKLAKELPYSLDAGYKILSQSFSFLYHLKLWKDSVHVQGRGHCARD